MSGFGNSENVNSFHGGLYGNFACFSFNFAANLKLLYKFSFLEGKEGTKFGSKSRYTMGCAQVAEHIVTEAGEKGAAYILQ